MPSASEYSGPKYHAVLHTENNNAQEISLYFSLGDYKTGLYQEDNWAYDLGPDSALSRIPPGDSDIIINIEMTKVALFLFCRDDTFAKPLHLLYSCK